MQALPTSLAALARDSISHGMILISQGEDVTNYPTQRNRLPLFSNTLLPAVAAESASSGAVTVRFLHDSTFDLRERNARRKKLEAASHVRHKRPEDEDEAEAEAEVQALRDRRDDHDWTLDALKILFHNWGKAWKGMQCHRSGILLGW